MKYTPKQVGLLQATILAVYIGFFAVSAFKVQNWTHMRSNLIHPILGIILFLLAFVISALISSSIIFIYPIILFFDGRKRDALKIIFWSAIWLVLIFIFVAMSSFFIIIKYI